MKVTLDARKMDEKAAAHAYLKKQLTMPDYYGNNLDALYDCLTEMDETEIVLTHFVSGSGYAKRILRVFLDASRNNPLLTLTVQEDEDAPSGEKNAEPVSAFPACDAVNQIYS